MAHPNLEIIEGELLALSGSLGESASSLEAQKDFQGKTSAAQPSMPGAMSRDALQRAGEELDGEISQIVSLLRTAAQDIANLDNQFNALDDQQAREYGSVSTQPEQ